MSEVSNKIPVVSKNLSEGKIVLDVSKTRR